MFNAKRKLKFNISKIENGMSEVTAISIPDIQMDDEETEMLLLKSIDDFGTTIDELDLLTSIDSLCHIVSNNWQNKYKDLLLTKDMIYRYAAALKMENKIVQNCVIKLLSNLGYEIRSILPIRMMEVLESGIIDHLMYILSPTRNPSEAELSIKYNILVCLCNLGYVEPVFKQELIKRNILHQIGRLLALTNYKTDELFHSQLLHGLSCVIPKSNKTNLHQLCELCMTIEEILFNTENESQQIYGLQCITAILRINEDISLDQGIAELLMSKLPGPNQSLTYAILECLCQLTGIDSFSVESIQPVDKFTQYICHADMSVK